MHFSKSNDGICIKKYLISLLNVVMIKIKVPATTANVGSGFDSFGIAFDIYNYFSIEESERFEFYNIEKRFANENNLCISSYKYFLQEIGKKPTGLKLTIKNDIPICRGLGSSSTLIIAGLMAGNILNGNILDKNEILNLSSKIEGHPDNVAPAIFGGMMLCVSENNKIYKIPVNVSNKVKFCALIPNFELSTTLARNVLPKKVDFTDAIFNTSRTAFLVKSLEEGDMEKIKIGIEDKLHQQYRKALIKDYDIIEDFVKHNGGCMCISGAGPTLLAIYQDDSFYETLSQSVKSLTSWSIKKVNIDRDGASIL